MITPRFSGNPKGTLEFLKSINYPYTWTEEALAKSLMFDLLDDDEILVGVIWFTWFNSRTLELHLAVSPEYKGRWITRKLMSDMEIVANMTGAEKGVAQATVPAHQRMLMKMGWKPLGLYMVKPLKNMKETDGQTQDTCPAEDESTADGTPGSTEGSRSTSES